MDSYIQWLSDIQFVGHLAAAYGRIHWGWEMTTNEMEFFFVFFFVKIFSEWIYFQTFCNLWCVCQ